MSSRWWRWVGDLDWDVSQCRDEVGDASLINGFRVRCHTHYVAVEDKQQQEEEQRQRRDEKREAD